MSEDLVRELLSDQARAVPVDADLLGAVAAGRQVRRRRRLVSGATGLAAVVVFAAVGTTVVVRHSRPATPSRPSVATAATSYPAGTRPVTWAGVQLDVPAAWTSAPSDPHRCARDDVKPGGEVDYAGSDASAAYACSGAPRPVHERLELGTAYSLPSFAHAQAGPPGTLESTPTTFAGYAAERVQTHSRGQLVTSITVPRLKTVFTLTTNTSAEASAIFDTAHVVSADENGCPVAQPRGFPSPTSGSGPVLSSSPAGGTVCGYAGGQLTTGVTLDAATTAELTAAIRRLPATYTASELAAQQQHPATSSAQVAQLTLRGADGRAQQVTVALGRSPGVAGVHRSALTLELLFDLGTVLPGSFGGTSAESSSAVPAGCQSCGRPTAPAPTRPVTYRDITLNVPATWVTTMQACARKASVELLTPATLHNCLNAPPSLVVSTIGPDGAFFAGGPPSRPLRFGGHRATTPDAFQVDVPDLDASYLVSGLPLASALAILATARPADGAQ